MKIAQNRARGNSLRQNNENTLGNAMNRSKSCSFARLLSLKISIFACIAGLFILLVGANSAFAVIDSWNVTGSTTYGTAGDWSTGAVPTASDTAVFSAATKYGNIQSKIGSAKAVLGVQFLNTGTTIISSNTSATEIWTIGTGGMTMSSGAGAVTISQSGLPIAVSLNGSQTWLNNSSNTMTDGAGIATGVSAATASTLTLNGKFTFLAPLADGAGGLSFLQSGGSVSLQGANTYTGVTTLSGGTVNLGVADVPGTSGPLGNLVTVGMGTMVLGGGYLQYSSANYGQNLDYSAYFSTIANQQYKVDTNGQSITWGSNLTSSNGTLTKVGAGMLTLGGNNTYTGGTNVSAGTLVLANVAGSATGSGPVSISNAMLTGSGTAGGNVSISSGAALFAGGTASTGAMGITGNLGLAGSSVFNINSSALTNSAVTGITNITYGGSLNINDLAGTPSYSAGETFQLFSFSGTESGSFSNTFNSNAVTGLPTLPTSLDWEFNYANGQLSIAAASAGSFSGLANWVSTGSMLWSNSANWADGTGLQGVPGTSGSAGHDTATFSSSASQTTVDLTGVTPNLAALSFSGSNFTLINSSLTLQSTGGTATVTVTGGSQTISSAVSLGSNTALKVSSGATLNISGSISGGNALSLAAANAGLVVLSGSNSYTGGTNIGGGTLQIANVSALGSGNLGLSGGTLDLNGYSPIVPGLSGASGVILSNSGAAVLTVNNSSNYTYGGALANGSGGLGLTTTSAGMLTLAGSNSYSGLTTIGGGTLQVGNPAALGSSTLTFGSSGGTLDVNGYNASVGGLTGNSGVIVSNALTTAGTLTVNSPSNYTYGGLLANGSGTLGLTKSGSGALALAGNNTFSGPLNVQSGTLAVGSWNTPGTAGPLGEGGSNSSRLQLGSSGQTATLEYSGASSPIVNTIFNLSGTAVFQIDNPAANVTLNSGTELNNLVPGTSQTVIKSGPGVLTLANNNSGLTNANIIVSGGVLASPNYATLGGSPVTLTLSGGTLDFNSASGFGTHSFNYPTTVAANSTIISELSSAGTGVTYPIGTLNIGGNTLTVSGGDITGGTAGLAFSSGALSGAATFNIRNPVGGGLTLLSTTGSIVNGGNNLTLTGNGNFAQSGTGSASGAGGFILSSGYSGSATLGQSNAYTGGTIISGGTLVAANLAALSTGAVTVNAAGTLNLSATNSGSYLAYPIASLSGSGTVNFNIPANTNIGLGDGTYGVNTSSFGGTINVYATAGSGNTSVLNWFGADSAATTINVEPNAKVYAGYGQNSRNVYASFVLYGGQYNLSDNFGQLRGDGGYNFYGSITLAGSIASGEYTIGNFGPYPDTVYGNIGQTGGSQPLVVSGNAPIILAGSNTYTGPTTISGGTLQIGNGTTGEYLASSSITVSGSSDLLIFNHADALTYSGAISGNGGLDKQGSGALTLSGNVALGPTASSTAMSVEAGVLSITGTTTLAFGNNMVVNNSGTLQITGVLNTSFADHFIGSTASSGTAVAILSGTGQWNGTSSDEVDVGITAPGLLKIQDSAQLNTVFLTAGAYSRGSIVQNGGTVILNPMLSDYQSYGPALNLGSSYYGGSAGHGEYHLNGGLLNSGIIGDTNSGGTAASTGVFYFNGGTLQANTSDLTDSTAITFLGQSAFMANLSQVVVQAGGAIIDSNGYSITIAQNLSHDSTLGALPDGGLKKLGAGTLILTQSSSYTGGTTISAGTLVAAGANILSPYSAVTLASGVLDVAAGSQSVAAFNMLGGTLNLDVSNLLIVTGTANFGGALNLSDTGSLTMSGGSLELIGYTSHSGSFSTSNVSSFPGYQLEYLSNQLDLVKLATGPAQWNISGSGSWNTGSNWTTNLSPSGVGVTALLGSAATSSATITLDSPQTLGTLTFANSSASYALTAGSAGSLTLDNTGGTIGGQIFVTSGTHSIAAPLIISSSAAYVSLSGSGSLDISGDIGQANGSHSLSLTSADGTGQLSLDGTNSFTGGLYVNSGVLVLNGAAALAPGSGLVIGATVPASTPMVISSPAAAPTVSLAPVPEPGTLTLLVVCAAAMGFGLWRRRA